jgi:hypothetical protein
MTNLAIATLICGAVVLLKGACLALAPRRMAELARAFPRNVWAGRILTAICVVWSAWLLRQTGFAWIDANPFLVYIAVPVAFVLIVVFMDELLAARALGGLLLLVPLPILESAFMHPSGSRLIMTVFAYLLVILGIVLVWSPYKLRQWTERWINHPPIARAVGAVGALVGAGMLALGWFVY